MLVGKLQDLRIRERANRSFTRIIETAGVPAGPIRPRKVVNVLLATLAGCFFGICMAFLQEFLDDRINSAEDSDRMVGLPGLAHIPLIPGEGAHLITALDPHSPVTESYRGLRSSIMFSAIEAPIHTMLVSSTMKGEGKSLTSINLAIAMAYEGKRVILVDADLRRPNIHRVLDLRDTPGLTDVLAGQATLTESLTPTGVPGFSVLAAGSMPPNPAELLNSEPMERLIEALRGCADIVIFDTPPCLPVIDAQVLAAKVDGVVLVAEVGEARKAAVQHARRLFDQAHARTLGIVFNKMTESLGEGYLYRRSYYTDEPKAIRNGKAHSVNGNGHVNGHAAFALKPLDTDQASGVGSRVLEDASSAADATPAPARGDTWHPTPDTRIREEEDEA
jgi:capsular exopolysaccharide synthesis family protein